MSNSSTGSCGIGFLGALGIAFIVLKLTHVIAWSWWWVTAPLWAVPAFLLLLFMICCLCAAFGSRK